MNRAFIVAAVAALFNLTPLRHLRRPLFHRRRSKRTAQANLLHRVPGRVGPGGLGLSASEDDIHRATDGDKCIASIIRSLSGRNMRLWLGRAGHHWGKMRQHLVSGSGGSIRCQKCFNQWPAYFAGGL